MASIKDRINTSTNSVLNGKDLIAKAIVNNLGSEATKSETFSSLANKISFDNNSRGFSVRYSKDISNHKLTSIMYFDKSCIIGTKKSSGLSGSVSIPIYKVLTSTDSESIVGTFNRNDSGYTGSDYRIGDYCYNMSDYSEFSTISLSDHYNAGDTTRRVMFYKYNPLSNSITYLTRIDTGYGYIDYVNRQSTTDPGYYYFIKDRSSLMKFTISTNSVSTIKYYDSIVTSTTSNLINLNESAVYLSGVTKRNTLTKWNLSSNTTSLISVNMGGYDEVLIYGAFSINEILILVANSCITSITSRSDSLNIGLVAKTINSISHRDKIVLSGKSLMYELIVSNGLKEL